MSDYVVRAIELPLQHLDGDWGILRECFRQATGLANWCVRRLLTNDLTLLPSHTDGKGKIRIPPMPKIKLYDEAGKAFGLMKKGSFWSGASGSFADIAKKVYDDYFHHRPAVIMGRESPPCYRYPHPFPIRAQEWKVAGFDDDGSPFVVVNFPSGIPRKPVQMRLKMRGKSGTKDAAEFARQLSVFKLIANGEHPKLQLVIREQPGSKSSHRPTINEKTPGGGNDRTQRVMIKMAARLPIQPTPGDRVINLTTDPAAMLVAEISGRREWIINADHVKRLLDWKAVHDARLQRWAEDCKAERRSSKRKRLQFNESRERACDKQRRRLHSWLQETVSHFVRFAIRRKAGLVVYDDSCRTFLPYFQWSSLRKMLGDKLAEAGVLMNQFDEENGDE